MNESDQAFDNLDLAVGRAIDDTIASIEAGDIDHALESLERAVKVSESHPLFSKRASSEFHRLEGLAVICERTLAATPERDRTKVRVLLDRIRALKRSSIH
jgi:hypothetical protein